MPSLKNSWPGSPDRFRKGSTAMLGSRGAGSGRLRSHQPATITTRSSATTAVRPRHRGACGRRHGQRSHAGRIGRG